MIINDRVLTYQGIHICPSLLVKLQNSKHLKVEYAWDTEVQVSGCGRIVPRPVTCVYPIAGESGARDDKGSNINIFV